MNHNIKRILNSILRGLSFTLLPWIFLFVIEKKLQISETEFGTTNVGLTHLLWSLMFIVTLLAFKKKSTIFEKMLYMVSIFFWGYLAYMFLC